MSVFQCLTQNNRTKSRSPKWNTNNQVSKKVKKKSKYERERIPSAKEREHFFMLIFIFIDEGDKISKSLELLKKFCKYTHSVSETMISIEFRINFIKNIWNNTLFFSNFQVFDGGEISLTPLFVSFHNK